MPRISAIPTEYHGILFRSRLEARWAIFFDCLGIKWHYESEGYSLFSGRWLPDFWLPGPSWTVEIKPEKFWQFDPSSFERTIRLIEEFHKETSRDVILICGQPCDYTAYGFGINGPDRTSVRLATGRRDAKVVYARYGEEDWSDGYFSITPVSEAETTDRWPLLDSDEIVAAQTKAKNYRFWSPNDA